MMDKPRKEQIYGIVGTLLFHIVVLTVLLLVVIERPPKQQESGVAVVMGGADAAPGDSYTYTEVKPAPVDVQPPQPQPQPAAPEPLITQSDEPSLEVPDAESEAKEQPAPVKTPEQIEQERLAAEAERKRQEAERLAREAEARIAGAFGKGAAMTDSGSAQQGSNSEDDADGTDDAGVTQGAGGYGTFDLGGRSLAGDGRLPRPVYDVQDEGRVVVNITVNPAGKVIDATINSRTNTSNPALRRAAVAAAKQAAFSVAKTVDNQMGTIVYYFKLK